METFLSPEEAREEEARFRAAVCEGIAQADQGKFIEESEMDARPKRMLRQEP